MDVYVVSTTLYVHSQNVTKIVRMLPEREMTSIDLELGNGRKFKYEIKKCCTLLPV